MTGTFPQIDRLLRHLSEERPGSFPAGEPAHVSRAPGRLDLMGGIADYSGALVFQWPLAVAVACAAQLNDAPECHCLSWIEPGKEALTAHFSIAGLLDLVDDGDEAAAYGRVRALFEKEPSSSWAAYALGGISVLAREKGFRPSQGLRLAFYSDVPLGAGVSSSAALEVAAFYAICSAYGVRVSRDEAAILCQKVENYVVGAPCGIMDQMTAAYGEAGKALPLLCQPHQRRPCMALPEGVAIWGIHSGERHAVGGSDYTGVRVGAFMGYRIIASLCGFAAEAAANGRTRVSDPEYGGYLANIPPSVFEARFAGSLPDTMRGDEFLETYKGTTDPATSVDPRREYRVLAATRHPVYEHHRVSLFAELLAGAELSEERLLLAGELMYQSHASYGACGLGSPGTDRLVEMVREAGPRQGLYGAKITGGGSGGTVAVLGKQGAGPEVERVAREYARSAGRGGLVLSGSSPGAERFGVQVAE